MLLSLWKCPLCGKQNSIRHYDPTYFAEDIIIILKRGLGYGRGWEKVDEYSLLDGSDPELLDLISDRVAVIYDMLYEDVKDDEAEGEHSVDHEDKVDFESLSELDKQIFLAEQEVEDEEEDEDIIDLDEEIIE